MKKILLCLLFLFITVSVQAQGTIFLPIIFKGNNPMAVNPRLVITDGTTEIDLLGPNSGWKLADPYWNPQIASYKGGGSMVNAQLAEGQRLVHKEYGNVTETIPLALSGLDQNRAMQTAHELLELLRQAGDYWAEPYEYDNVWIEVKLACNSCLTGYSRIIKGDIPELTNPFGQPFFSSYDKPVMENITIAIEREPFWRGTKPGEIIGPLYNLIDNPDFELWNFGVTDSQPDSWIDIETTHIIGQNSRDQTLPKFGNSDLKIRVSGSTLAGASKGVTQVINDTDDNTEYTILAWVRSEGVSNGVGRILITYASQLELYRDSDSHGWTLYTGKITTGINDTVAIHCEILTTAANTDGTIYIDSLMFVKGNYEQEAKDGVLPYLSGSHIVNNLEIADDLVKSAGTLNFLDVWNIPGNVDSLIRLELTNNTNPADSTNPVEIYNKMRIGLRRTGTIFNFDYFRNFAGTNDTTASGGGYAETDNLSTAKIEVGSEIIDENTLDNAGRFRAYARIYDPATVAGNLQTRMEYYKDNAEQLKILDLAKSNITSNWQIVDLTEKKAVIWDAKFQPNIPSQFGYNIDMNRLSGTDKARLDYSILMPTDGGFIEITASPPLNYKSLVAIDNTEGQLFVSGINKPSSSGWVQDVEIPGTSTIVVTAFINFRGFLFAIGYDTPAASREKIWRLRNGKWGNVFTGVTPGTLDAAAIYNGELFVGGRDGRILKSSNGLTWELVSTSFTGDDDTFVMAVYNSLLFVAVGNNGSSSNQSDIYYYDGSSWTEDIPSLFLQDFETYADNLFGVSNQTAWRRITIPNPPIMWEGASPLFSTAEGMSPFKLISFKGKLVALCADTGFPTTKTGAIAVFSGGDFNPNGWEFSQPLSEATNITNGIVFNNKLYVSSVDDDNAIVKIWSTPDLETWTLENQITVAAANSGNRFGKNKNNLYFSAGTSAQVQSSSISNAAWRVLEFEGVGFLAPPEKRHRYIFSYDREDFVNNINDKALIGVGFVPRYLTLRGKN